MLRDGDADAPVDQVVHILKHGRSLEPQAQEGNPKGHRPPDKHWYLPSLHPHRRSGSRHSPGKVDSNEVTGKTSGVGRGQLESNQVTGKTRWVGRRQVESNEKIGKVPGMTTRQLERGNRQDRWFWIETTGKRGVGVVIRHHFC